jgi:hypothetical protein
MASLQSRARQIDHELRLAIARRGGGVDGRGGPEVPGVFKCQSVKFCGFDIHRADPNHDQQGRDRAEMADRTSKNSTCYRDYLSSSEDEFLEALERLLRSGQTHQAYNAVLEQRKLIRWAMLQANAAHHKGESIC